MTDIRIRNSSIDSNNWVNLKGAMFTPSFKRMNEAIPINGVQTATLPEGDRIGLDVPIITIKGYINVDDFASTAELWSETPSTVASSGEDGTSNANTVTLGYLNRLWRENSGQTQLEIYFGNPTSQKQWKNWNNSSTTLYVIVDDVNPVPEESSEGLHFITYTIVCREVQADSTFDL